METPDDMEEKASRLSQQLLAKTQPLGLYLRNTYMTPEEEGSDTVVVYAEFTLGDVAFSDRVQHPEKAKADDEARLMMAEAQMDDLDAEIMRERWEQWKKREHLKGGDDADTDTGGTSGDD